MSEDVIQQNKTHFMEIFQSKVTRDGAKEFLNWLEGTDFFVAPASTRFHLAAEGGLVEHSLHVYERLRAMFRSEKTSKLNTLAVLTPEEEESIAICGLLHDVCKVNFYKQEPRNQKTYDPAKVSAAGPYKVKHDSQGDFIWETVMKYVIDDQYPFGHGEKSVRFISDHMKLSTEEAMAIRWHMGGFDDAVKGGSYSVREAFNRFPLAIMTHLADMQASYLDEAE